MRPVLELVDEEGRVVVLELGRAAEVVALALGLSVVPGVGRTVVLAGLAELVLELMVGRVMLPSE